jgi:hypothetical protein
MMHFDPERPWTTLDAPHALATAAIRCWRAARDEGKAVQRCLYAMLSRHDCEILAPEFDSFIALCEAALGRGIVVGTAALSEDETLLLGLFDGARYRRSYIACGNGTACVLDCAIRSTRIMMALTIEVPLATARHRPIAR